METVKSKEEAWEWFQQHCIAGTVQCEKDDETFVAWTYPEARKFFEKKEKERRKKEC